jgi:DNA repair exonuclease SbcCD ATPase subunit
MDEKTEIKTLAQARKELEAQASLHAEALAQLETSHAAALAVLTSERDALAQKACSLTEAQEKLEVELSASKKAFADISAQAEALKAEAKTVEAKAAEVCASVGVDPVPGVAAKLEASNTATLAEFNAMSVEEKVKFGKARGKIEG